eukprot:TRINITY_DN1591_c1_g1_i1.p1 TRINITY_DN1591_c1_g1~~TRINITY_DN1591_c1_g1_i1.p1  ORF type:complete len:303 (+),score=68.00 TRINITY_DN1591_c1_g1_i1:315-1223(+)
MFGLVLDIFMYICVLILGLICLNFILCVAYFGTKYLKGLLIFVVGFKLFLLKKKLKNDENEIKATDDLLLAPISVSLVLQKKADERFSTVLKERKSLHSEIVKYLLQFKELPEFEKRSEDLQKDIVYYFADLFEVDYNKDVEDFIEAVQKSIGNLFTYLSFYHLYNLCTMCDKITDYNDKIKMVLLVGALSIREAVLYGYKNIELDEKANTDEQMLDILDSINPAPFLVFSSSKGIQILKLSETKDPNNYFGHKNYRCPGYKFVRTHFFSLLEKIKKHDYDFEFSITKKGLTKELKYKINSS